MLLLPAPTYLPSRRANTIQVMKMAQAFTRLGVPVHLTVPDPHRRPAPDWETLERHYGLRERFPITWLPAHPRWRGYEYAARVIRLARREPPALLFTRHPQVGAAASLLGIAAVLEVHDLPQGRLGPLWFRAFLRGRGARALVVITRALREALPLEGFSRPVLLLPDGVDLERYASLPDPAAARAALGLPPRFTAGYTGHLYAGRGADLLLSLAERLPQVTFLLAGGRPADVERLRAAARAAGLRNLILTGFLPNADLPLYQAACDVLLMPYQRRVAASSGGDIARYFSPMKVFEYLASGRAILSSDLPALREVLRPENALLLPPESLDAWERALRTAMAQPQRLQALAERARRDAAAYTWEARARRILAAAGLPPARS